MRKDLGTQFNNELHTAMSNFEKWNLASSLATSLFTGMKNTSDWFTQTSNYLSTGMKVGG